MSKEIIINDLVFEVTRKCNKVCDHCYRGEKTSTNMIQKMTENALNEVVSIGKLTFTGGEPTLNVKAIRDIIHNIIRNEIQVTSFSITLNGTVYKEELVDVLYDLYDYVSENYGERDMCELIISSNQFQEPNIDVLNKYSKLPFYKEDNEKYIPESEIINEGFAYENGLGFKELELSNIEIEIYGDEINVVNGCVYINALGDVLTDCNLSYKKQRKYKKGNVLKQNLSDIILKEHKK